MAEERVNDGRICKAKVIRTRTIDAGQHVCKSEHRVVVLHDHIGAIKGPNYIRLHTIII